MAKSSGTKLTKYTNGSTIVTADAANALYGGLHGSTEGDAYVAGDPVIAGHVHDGSHADGHAQKVNVDTHVTGQLKNVNLADDAVVARNVQGFTTQGQAIPEFEVIGLDTFYYLDLSDLRAEIGLVSTADISFLAPNEYYVDTSGVDNSDIRFYSSLALAITAAETEQVSNEGYVIRLKEGQTHLWLNPSWSATQDISITSSGSKKARLAMIGGILAAGTSKKINFCNLSISQESGSITDTGTNGASFESCEVSSLAAVGFDSFYSISASNTKFTGTRFGTIGLGGITYENCTWKPSATFAAGLTVFDFADSSTSYFKECDFDVTGISNWNLFNRTLGTPLIKVHGCNISVENTGGGSARVFGNSASLSAEIRNTQVTRSGAGIVNFGSAIMAAGYTGLSWHGDKPNLLDHPAETWFLTSDISFLAANEYYVDTTATINPEQRIYTTVAGAISIADAEQTAEYIIRLREGQAHSWAGGLSSNLNVSIIGQGNKASSLSLGAVTMTSVAGVRLSFSNIAITQGSTISSTSKLDSLKFDNCDVSSLTGFAWSFFANISLDNTAFTGTRFTSIGAGTGTGFVLARGCSWTPGAGFPATQTIVSLTGTGTSDFTDCNFNVTGISDWTLFSRGGTPTLKVHGCNISVENTGGGTARIFGNSASLTAEIRNTEITRSGVGIVNFGSATMAAGYTGLSWHGNKPDALDHPTETWFADTSFLAPNEYYVDSTATTDVSLRIYATVAAAVTAAELVQTDDYIIRLREGQSHSWAGTGFSGTLNVIFNSVGSQSTLTLSAFSFTAGTGVYVRFKNLYIFQTGNITDAGGLHTVVFDETAVQSYVLAVLGGYYWRGFLGVIAANSSILLGTTFQLIGQNGLYGGFNFSNSSWEQGFLFPNTSTVFETNTDASNLNNSFVNCQFKINDVGWTLFSGLKATPLALEGCSIVAKSAGGTSSLFGVNLTLGLRNVQFTRYGTGTLNFGVITASEVIGVSWHGTVPNDDLLPSTAWRSSVVEVDGITVTATAPGITYVLKEYDISSLLVQGGSFKIRWNIYLDDPTP
jgi:hypothetical protein